MLDILVMFGLFTLGAVWFLVRYDGMTEEGLQKINDRITRVERDYRGLEDKWPGEPTRSLITNVETINNRIVDLERDVLHVREQLASKRPIIRISKSKPTPVQIIDKRKVKK